MDLFKVVQPKFSSLLRSAAFRELPTYIFCCMACTKRRPHIRPRQAYHSLVETINGLDRYKYSTFLDSRGFSFRTRIVRTRSSLLNVPISIADHVDTSVGITTLPLRVLVTRLAISSVWR